MKGWVNLGMMLRGTGLVKYAGVRQVDFWGKFKVDEGFGEVFVKEGLRKGYKGDWRGVNSVAGLCRLQMGDYMEREVGGRVVAIREGNWKFAERLVEWCSEMGCEVEVKVGSGVCGIKEVETGKGEGSGRYVVESGDGVEKRFDAVFVCADLDLEETSLPESVVSVFEDNDDDKDDEEEERSPCTHIAIVCGVLKASFFKFMDVKNIPDVVDFIHCEDLSRVERLFPATPSSSATSNTRKDVYFYRIICSSKFEEVFDQVFVESSRLLHFSKRKERRRAPVLSEEEAENVSIVLGTRFINLAVGRKIARDVEWDFVNAMNGASLLSSAVKWEDRGNDESRNDEADEDEARNDEVCNTDADSEEVGADEANDYQS